MALTLEVSFKPDAAGRDGRSYEVEVRAVNDAGEVQGFAPAGPLTIDEFEAGSLIAARADRR